MISDEARVNLIPIGIVLDGGRLEPLLQLGLAALRERTIACELFLLEDLADVLPFVSGDEWHIGWNRGHASRRLLPSNSIHLQEPSLHPTSATIRFQAGLVNSPIKRRGRISGVGGNS